MTEKRQEKQWKHRVGVLGLAPCRDCRRWKIAGTFSPHVVWSSLARTDNHRFLAPCEKVHMRTHTHTLLLKLAYRIGSWSVLNVKKKNKHSTWKDRSAVELGKLAVDATHSLIWSKVLNVQFWLIRHQVIPSRESRAIAPVEIKISQGYRAIVPVDMKKQKVRNCRAIVPGEIK